MSSKEHPTELTNSGFDELLAASKRGDSDAMEQLFQLFYPTVERMVHAGLSRDLRVGRPWLHSRFSTGDVVQEVFRGLLRNLDSFKGATEAAFCGYLAMVVRNRLIDAVRFHEAAQRDGRRTAPELEDEEAQHQGSGPGTDAASSEELRHFREIIGTFEEREQLLLRGRLEQDVSFKDLAEQLGYSSRSTAQRVFYAAQAKLVIRLRQRHVSDNS